MKIFEKTQNIKKGERERENCCCVMSNTNMTSQDRLGLHGPVPIPAPLVIRKKHAPKRHRRHIDQTASLARSPSPTPAELYSTTMPQYQPQPQEDQPHPTKPIQANNLEKVSMLPPLHPSSHNASNSESPLPHTNLSAIPSTRSRARHQSLLSALPRHLQPENRYSPRPFPGARPYIPLAAATTKHELGFAGGIKKQNTSSGAYGGIHEASQNQGRSHHSPTGSTYSFTGESRTLEAEILALLDNMSRARKRYSAPPCPPPNYPPPQPPTQGSRRQSSGGLPGSAIAT